jgi:hypothetical protein
MKRLLALTALASLLLVGCGDVQASATTTTIKAATATAHAGSCTAEQVNLLEMHTATQTSLGAVMIDTNSRFCLHAGLTVVYRDCNGSSRTWSGEQYQQYSPPKNAPNWSLTLNCTTASLAHIGFYFAGYNADWSLKYDAPGPSNVQLFPDGHCVVPSGGNAACWKVA